MKTLITKTLSVRSAAVFALLLAIPAAAFAQDKASPVKYKRTVIKNDFMKFPANAIAIGMHGENKGKLIGALGMRNRIKIMDPDSERVLKRGLTLS